MKTLILALLLVPLITFAHEKTPPVCTDVPSSSNPGKPDSPSPAPLPPIVPPPPIPVAPVPSKTAPSSPSGGGGGTMPYCSGPLSPGWHVDIPGGGCAPVNKPIVIHLNQLPRTGLTFWQWLWQLI